MSSTNSYSFIFKTSKLTISCVNTIFQTVFKTLIKDKDKIINVLGLYSNAKLEATNNLIKVIREMLLAFETLTIFKLEFSSL